MLKKFAFALTLGLSAITQSNAHSTEFQNEFNFIEMTFNKTNWQTDHDLFAIHVIPKCGTHFIQHTLYLMTNQETSNFNLTVNKLSEVCSENKLLRTFQPYDKNLARLLVDADHKLISVIRDPRDALISHVFYMRTFSTRQTEDKTKRDFFTVGKNFDDLSLDEQITSLIKGENGCMSYIDFYKERIGWALNPRHLSIKYEEMLSREGGGTNKLQRMTVKKIAAFINLSLSNEQLENVLHNMYKNFGEKELEDGRVFERATTGNWRTFLTEEHKKEIKKRIGKEMIQLGYAEDTKW